MTVIGREAERQQEPIATAEKSSVSPEDESVAANYSEKLPVAAQMDAWIGQSLYSSLDRSRYKGAQESLNKAWRHCSLKRYTKCEGLRGP